MIFDPRGIPIGKYRKSYPELETVPEFEPLKEDELRVAWWFSCQSSPIIDMPDEERMCKAAYEVWNDTEIAEAYSKSFTEQGLPTQELILEAIDKMGTFSPAARERANSMNLKIFDQYEDTLDEPKKNYKKADGTIDQNAYISVRQKIQAQIPKCIENIEMGFGTHKYKEMKDRTGHQNIETYLKNKESNSKQDLD